MARSTARPYVLAALSAAVIAALIGLALLLILLALHADRALATVTLSAMHGQMSLANVAGALARGGSMAQRYLAK